MDAVLTFNSMKILTVSLEFRFFQQFVSSRLLVSVLISPFMREALLWLGARCTCWEEKVLLGSELYKSNRPLGYS